LADPTPQQALEQLAAQAPFRKRHLRLFLISIGGTFMDGYATLMTGVALPLFTLQEHPDPFLVQGSLEVKQYSVPGLVLASPPVPEVL